MICSKCKELTKEVSEWKDKFDAVSIELIKKCFEINDLKAYVLKLEEEYCNKDL